MSRRITTGAIAVGLVAVGLIGLGVLGWLSDWHLGVDSTVYRSGAIALLRGDPLYADLSLPSEPDWARLPFTYPPVAAALFAPLALVPTQVAWGLLGAVSIVALAAVVKVTVRRIDYRPEWMERAWVPAVLCVAAVGLEPVWRTLALGQVNILLMALVVLDVLWVKRFGGVLTGVAAAVKLTPLIFVVHLLVTGRPKDAARAVGTFAALQGLMFLIAPGDALAFWQSAVRDPHRIGPIYYTGNQSINGFLLRLTDDAGWTLQAALAIGALLAVPALLWVRRFHQTGDPVPALLVTAFLGLLVSPVSWSHHWVWAVPLVVFLCTRSLKSAALAAAVFASCVLIVVHGLKSEFDWNATDFLLGSAYLAVAATGAVVLLTRRCHRPG